MTRRLRGGTPSPWRVPGPARAAAAGAALLLAVLTATLAPLAVVLGVNRLLVLAVLAVGAWVTARRVDAIDLGAAGPAIAGAYAGGVVLSLAGAPVLLGLPVAAAAGALVGALNGAIAGRVGRPLSALTSILLAAGVVAVVAAWPGSGGRQGYHAVALATGSDRGDLVVLAAVLGLAVLSVGRFAGTPRAGVAALAVAAPEAAAATGVLPAAAAAVAGGVGGTVLGIGGWGLATAAGSVSPATFGLGLSVGLALAAVLGGGLAWGGVVGALFLHGPSVLWPTLPVVGDAPLLVLGPVGLVVLALRPEGLVPRRWGGEVPGRREGEVPGRREGEVPGAWEGEVPGRREGEVPGAWGGEVPGWREGEVPGRWGGEVPGRWGGEVPGRREGDASRPGAPEPADQPRPTAPEPRLEPGLLRAEDLAGVPGSAYRFTVGPGEVLAIVGPNGSGKSTLLARVAGQLDDGGAVTLGGRRLRPGAVRRARAGLARTWQRPPAVAPVDRVAAVLAVGGSAAAAHWVGTLLGPAAETPAGADLVALAASRPRVAVLDEPGAHLPPEAVVRLLRGLADGGCAVLVAEHRLEVLAAADRVVTLDRQEPS